MSILSIEPDQRLAAYIRQFLEPLGYPVITAATFEEGLAHIDRGGWDVVLTNGMDPQKGTCPEMIRSIREHANVPIIAFGPEGVSRTIDCLDAGADFYESLPIHQEVLCAMVRAATRRGSYRLPVVICLGDLEYDPRRPIGRHFSVRGEVVRFSPSETDMLELLMRQQGHLVSYAEIMEARQCNCDTDSTKVLLWRLKKRLQRYRTNIRLENIRNLGYRLVAA